MDSTWMGDRLGIPGAVNFFASTHKLQSALMLATALAFALKKIQMTV